MAKLRIASGSLSTFIAAISVLACQAAWASDVSERAEALAAKGDLRAATIELKSALQQNPNDAKARLALARIYLRTGNGAAAEKEIRTAIDLGAGGTQAPVDLAEALVLQGKYDEALQRLDAAPDLPDAERARATVLRGDAAAGQGKADEARALYAEAAQIDPSNERATVGLLRLALIEGDTAAAAKQADAFLEQFPDSADVLLIRADLHRAEGQYETSIGLFDRILAKDPKNMLARLGRATALIGLKNLDQARKDLDLVDQIQQDVPMTAYLRGVIEFQQKDWSKAAEYFDRVRSSAPGHVPSQLLLGIIRYSQGQLATADELLTNVVAAAPANLQARKVLAAINIKKREPKRAIEILEPVSQDGDPQTMALLGSAYMLAGDSEKGQDWLNRAVEKAPDVAALRTQLALSLLAGGQTGKAIDELQSAVDLGQDVLQADVMLVLAHIKNKELDKAVAAGAALEQRRPQSPIAYNLTGLAYMAKGDLPAARARFEKALQVDPKFVTAEINLARLEVAEKNLDAAKAHYEAALKQSPKHLGAFLGLAAVAELNKDPQAVVSALERAQDANPKATQPGLLLTGFYIGKGDYAKALSVATDMSKRFPDDQSVLQMLARAQTLGGQASDAIRTFDELIRKNPRDAQLTYLSGAAHWKSGDYTGAQIAFKGALDLKPDLIDAQVALVSVSLEAGDTETAMRSARALQAARPDAALGYQLEGNVFLSKRDFKAAAGSYRNALSRQPSGAIARQLAQALTQAGDTKAALEVLEDWTQKNPSDLDSQAMIGLSLQQLGRASDAIAVYEKILEQAKTKSPLLMNNLAWLYQDRGDARAESLAKQAYDLAPNKPEIADTYGWILYNSGKKSEGLSILQQAYLAFPTQTEIGYHVAVALDGLGRGQEAVQVLRKMLQDNPKSDQAADAAKLLKKLGG
jgi:putative PEP-CTERM system TPR-repeat lipoprotein